MSSQLNGSSFTQRKIATFLASLALFGITQISHAASIALEKTEGAWPAYSLVTGAYPGSDQLVNEYSFTNSGVTSNGLFWGEPADAEISTNRMGLLYTPASNGSQINLGEAFTIGKLSHYNYAIYSDTAITNAYMDLKLSLTGASPVTTTVGFGIASSCPSVPLNTDPCDDKISFSAASTQFNLDGNRYSFNLLGFYKDQTTFAFDMTTTAQTANAQWLMASITAVPTTPVPAPAALWLLGSGLLGLAGFAKRKRIHQ